MQRICIVGLGNMGQSIHDILKSTKMFVVNGLGHNDDPELFLPKCDLIVLAIKPQDFEAFCKTINTDISDKIVISIMAGVSVSKIEKMLGAKKVVRAMPNLPLKVGRSLTGWYCNDAITEVEKIDIVQLLKGLGEEVEVTDEGKINCITALSGSGPAYFYKLTQIFQEAAEEYGFSEEDAIKIAESTLIGSAQLLLLEDKTSDELRAMITSKGGTTEAAFKYMKENKLDLISFGAIEAARKRAEELGDE